MQEEKTLYGFYSERGSQENGGLHKYKTPDGGDVLVTYVSTDPTASGYLYPDKKAVGIVTDFVETVIKNKKS